MERLTIKEAGRYANFLDKSLSSLTNLVYGGLNSKLIKVVENHKRSEANKEAVDEEITIEFDSEIDVELDVLTDIIENMVTEKAKLADEIAKAKKDIAIEIENGNNMNLDSSIEYAKLLRRVAGDYYNILSSKKDSKRKEMKRGYAFNVEGNQTSYLYEAEIVTTLQYDKNIYIEKNKKFKMLADKISEKIEKAMSSDLVDFKPQYNYLDGIEDIIAKHIGV